MPVDINTPPNYAFEQRSPREFFMFDVDGSPLEDGCELTLYKFPHMELVGKNRVVRHEVTDLICASGVRPLTSLPSFRLPIQDVRACADRPLMRVAKHASCCWRGCQLSCSSTAGRPALGMQEKVDEEVQRRWIDMCKKINIREGGAPRLYTVENDVEVGDLLMVDSNWKCTSMKFINSYLHDGLAGMALGLKRSAPKTLLECCLPALVLALVVAAAADDCSKHHFCSSEQCKLLAGGAQPKGAHVILIENCIIERVNLAGIGVGFDPFWYTFLISLPALVTFANCMVLSPCLLDMLHVCMQR